MALLTIIIAISRKIFELCEKENTKGAIVHSRSRFVQEGERNTRFFLKLERKHYEVKNMQSIINAAGELVTEPKQILE